MAPKNTAIRRRSTSQLDQGAREGGADVAPPSTKQRVAAKTPSSKVDFYPPSDTYLRIGGEWYDFRKFKHPGGQRVLEVARDRFEDATYLFESHHMNYKKARKIISKYRVDESIVDPKGRPADLKRPEYELPKLLPDDAFYSVFRTRVQAYLNKVGCPSGGPTWGCVVLYWVILASFLASCFGLYTYANPKWSGLCALTGAWLGAFGHNWTHQPKYQRMGWGVLSLDLVGFSSETWARDHNMQHHAYTNTPADNHFRGTDPFLITDPSVKRNFFQRYVTPVLHPLVLIFGVYGNYIIHTVELLNGRETFSIGKVFLPLQIFAMTHKHGAYGFFLMFLAHAALSQYYFTMALMNHNAEHCHDMKRRDKAKDWGEHQLIVCADWGLDFGFLPSIVFLWLNFHGVHHLVPKLDASHQPEVQKILVKTCEEFGLKYHADSGFFRVWWEMLQSFSSPSALGKEIFAYNGQF